MSTPDPKLFKAAVIDEQGKEIPITDEMIVQACLRFLKEEAQRSLCHGNDSEPGTSEVIRHLPV